MDLDQLKNWMDQIVVKNMVNADVEVENNSPLIMMGKGRQGAVFQLSEDVCVKVFGNTEDCDREHYALSLGQHTNLFPKLYGKGPLYIVMEIIKGVDVREYLQSHPLTPELSWKLIEMLITFKQIGFERIDHHKRQIFIQPDGNLKVIDVARTVWRDRVYPYPRKLLTSLGEENKAIFLSHVQELAPELYNEWLHYIRMEEISHQIFQLLLPEKTNKKELKNRMKQLMTTEDETIYLTQLEGLVHKVFKEEWVKTMLARGKDPEAVMEKINKHWDSLKEEYFPSQGRFRDKEKYSKEDKYSRQDRFLNEGKRLYGSLMMKNNEKPESQGRRFEGEKLSDNDGWSSKSRKRRNR